jgi:hypothetical protein
VRRKQTQRQRRYNPRKEAQTMTVKDIAECINTQRTPGRATLEKEVVLRVAGKDYAIRRIDASTATIVLEGGEEVIHEDSLERDLPQSPGGQEGEGVEPAPPAVGQVIMAAETTPQENQES